MISTKVTKLHQSDRIIRDSNYHQQSLVRALELAVKPQNPSESSIQFIFQSIINMAEIDKMQIARINQWQMISDIAIQIQEKEIEKLSPPPESR